MQSHNHSLHHIRAHARGAQFTWRAWAWAWRAPSAAHGPTWAAGRTAAAGAASGVTARLKKEATSSAATSDSTARKAAAAASLMSGARCSKPTTFSISFVEDCSRALRNSAVAVQTAACGAGAARVRRGCGAGAARVRRGCGAGAARVRRRHLLRRGGCEWSLRTLAWQPADQSARDLAQHNVHVVLLPHEHQAVGKLGLRLGRTVGAWRRQRGKIAGDRRRT